MELSVLLRELGSKGKPEEAEMPGRALLPEPGEVWFFLYGSIALWNWAALILQRPLASQTPGLEGAMLCHG